MRFVAADHSLVWQKLDDTYFVFQASSAETHVFNETTALILECLQYGPLSAEMLRERAAAALGVSQDELVVDDFAFATMRLEELGLIERLDEDRIVQ